MRKIMREGAGRTVSKPQRGISIICTVVAACVAMALVDGLWQPPYAVKSAVKLLFFVAAPLAYMFLSKDRNMMEFFVPKKRGLLVAAIAGAAIYGITVGGFFLLRGVIDFSKITESLTNGEGITRDNFVFVALYITVVNSFCEELIFRAFAFGALGGALGKKVGYAFSSVAFAAYHIAIMTGWFDPVVFVLLIAALAAAGLVLDWFDDRAGCIYPAWILHACANLAINTIGCVLFGIF